MLKSELELKLDAARIRIGVLRGLRKIGAGHVGGSMSIADLLAVLYGGVMNVRPDDPSWADRDWLVVSKGHSGPAVYSTLALKGFFPQEMLDTINQGGTNLPSHCDRNKTPGVDMTTGSLGQGMSTGVGVAFGNLYQGKKSYTYIVLGDGEIQEGQVWEGVMFAAQQKLSNLITFVDYNKKQLDGYVKDINDLGDIAQKFRDFGWFAQEVDGHDVASIAAAVEIAKKGAGGRPSVIVMHTEKGTGCNFSEGVLYNHHQRFSQEDVDGAIACLEKNIAELENNRGACSCTK